MYKKVKTVTLGCYKNLVDSERLMRQFQVHGFQLIPEDDSSQYVDLVVINTCGFIHDAKMESIDTILAYVEEKQRGNVGKIVVFGCLSERYADELKVEIPEVDFYFGKFSLADIINVTNYSVDDKHLYQRVLTTPSHYAYLKISEGCNRKCAFCAIPKITGKHQSTPIEMLIKEASYLAYKGVKELILVAQDLNPYGLDLSPKANLYELIQRISEINGIEWIRLQYLYPKGFPAKLPEIIANNPKVCHYIDIPFQHASNKILARMNRQHSLQDNWDIVKKLRKIVPDIAIRTTLIVGFPGETYHDFQTLLRFVEMAEIDRLGAFTYSHEENTPAARKFSDSVLDRTKQKRLLELMALQEKISLKKNEAKVGTRQKVIIDKQENGYYVGRTQYDSPEIDNEVTIYNPNNLSFHVGDFIQVEITGALPYDLEGIAVNKW